MEGNEMNAAERKRERMLTGSIPKLILSFALPATIAMVITSVYNMADSLFLGRVSTPASTAVGVVFSYMAFCQAFGFFFGHGSGNSLSRALGAGKRDEAKKTASVGFFLSIVFGTLFCLAGFCALDPLLRVMGATDTSIDQARGYFIFVLLSTPFAMGSLTLNNQMRFQGNALFSMIGIGFGGLLNIALDPLFIFAFRLEAMGAGIATCLSQMVSFFLLLFLSGKKDNIAPRLKDFRPSNAIMGEIWRGGVPSLGRQGLMAVAGVCLNQACAFSLQGSPSELIDSAIAAFSTVNRLCNFAASIAIGIGQGFQPVCGFNYGAKQYGRVKKAFWFSVLIATVYSLAVAILGMAFPREFVGFIRSEDPDLLAIGEVALRQESYVFAVLGANMVAGMYLQTIGKSVPATIAAMARSGLFYIPLLFGLGYGFGIAGLQWAQPIADLGAFVISMPIAVAFLYRMGKGKRSEGKKETNP